MSEQTPDVPSVLVVVVVKDGASWVRASLASLARQTHPRVGVLAVDNGSRDGTDEVLRRVLGARRFIRLRRNVGFGGAVARALEVPAAAEADYVLLVHDDAALAPDAVERLLETARRVRGAGIVAPKVLDWTRPGVLLEIGHAADRFGYPYSPLEEGEIDQGQYDAPREVLFVSSAAMLVSREVLKRIAPLDDRLASGRPELDFCWRARMAGFRVLVDPRAVAAHRLAGERGERPGAEPEGGRYLADRAGLVAVLKNYRLVNLLWILPTYAVQAVGRFLFYLFSRHAERSLEVARAWGWNIAHLPGTIRRRFAAQRARRVGDREISRFQVPAAARLQRWALQASSLLVARRAGYVEEEEELEAPPLPRRVASVAVAHPVAVAWLVAAIATLIAFRDVLFVPSIEGGSLGVLPEGPLPFFREFGSAWRSTGFGGSGGASPALVVLGAGSFLALGQPMLLMRLLVAMSPILAAISAYIAIIRITRERGPAVVAAASYALSALGLWTASEGSLPALAVLVVTPWLAVRISQAFHETRRPLRWILLTGAGVALAGSFFPAVWIAGVLLWVPMILLPDASGRRARGVALVTAAAVIAAVLVFPFALELLRAGGGTTVGATARPDLASVLRLSPGAAPGSGLVALFLPVAGVLGFAFVEGRSRQAARALMTAAVGLSLAWLAAAGHLPPLVANPLAYLAPAAFSLSLLVGLGIDGLATAVRRAAFGLHQVAAVALVLVVVLGLSLQLLDALGGAWAVGESRHPPAWPVVATAGRGQPFRVLWVGSPDGDRFPPPGGPAEGVVAAGPASVRYGVTGRGGRSVLAVGLPSGGPAYGRLEEVLSAILSGRIRHGGSLLGPFGIRFIVAASDDLPAATAERLALQLDLDLVQTAGGLRIYRNSRALPVAAALPGTEAEEAIRSGDLLAPTSIDPETAVPLRSGGSSSWSGRVAVAPSVVHVATTFDDGWHLEDGEVFPAFGWALGGETGSQEVALGFDRGVGGVGELVVLGLLWALVLWTALQTSTPATDRTRPPRHREVEHAMPVPERPPVGGRR